VQNSDLKEHSNSNVVGGTWERVVKEMKHLKDINIYYVYIISSVVFHC